MTRTRSRSAWVVSALVWMSLCAAAGAADQVRQDVVYVPTPYDVVENMLALAEVGPDDVVYDLGCGDGRIVVSAARRFGSRGVGYEIVPELVELSRDKVRAAAVEDLVSIERRDIFTVDLGEATVLMLYLGWELNTRLVPQIAQMAPGSRIVSHHYGMIGIEPDRVVQFTSREDGVERTLFVWRTPLRPTVKQPSGDTPPPESAAERD